MTQWKDIIKQKNYSLFNYNEKNNSSNRWKTGESMQMLNTAKVLRNQQKNKKVENSIQKLITFWKYRCTGENLRGGCRAKFTWQILIHKNMIMIRSTINILLLVFTYLYMLKRNNK